MPLPDGVVIRRGTPDDAERMGPLHVDVWEEAYTGLVPRRITTPSGRGMP